MYRGVNGLNLYLTANTVPVICAPLQNQCIELSRDNIPHLQGLKLANNSFGHSELEIDLLVGAEFYWGNMDPPQLNQMLDGFFLAHHVF